nr:bifunctional phosphoribosylaminoimidazolecarboxamide formyltransferase/IMP cyclohydrolase [Saprospiraceae bacterium]
LTDYPAILDGRVKTLHPKIFGGLLAKREEAHLEQLLEFEIPTIDCVIVDLYPFEKTVAKSNDEKEIIEKIDIGGVSLIRAAAKNCTDVVVVASKMQYPFFEQLLLEKQAFTDLEDRKKLARWAFQVTSHYDTAIFQYFDRDNYGEPFFKQSFQTSHLLRYGENPHQKAIFFGDFNAVFNKISGKEISYNNLVDIDAALALIIEFENDDPTFAVLKHTNACGVATRKTVNEAWKTALQSDPISAFGGIIICNTIIDKTTALEISTLFYEVLIAKDFTDEAITILTAKKQRTLLKIKQFYSPTKTFRSLLNGVIQQESDHTMRNFTEWELKTKQSSLKTELEDLFFANKCVKHLKSNAIALIKNKQLIGMGCGQTSRIDALHLAIAKAKNHGFNLQGAVLASDAFFPFADCVEIAHKVGINSIVQPGGSVKDQDSIDYCNNNGVEMYFTNTRHFKH